MAEYLHHFLTVQHLFDKAVHQTQMPLLAHVVFARQFGKVGRHDEHDAGRQQRDDGQGGVEQDHRDEGGEHRHTGVDDLGNTLAQQLAQGVDVVGVHRHDVAVGVGVKVGDGQGFHAVEQVVPQAAHGALADGDHDAVVAEGRYHTNNKNAGQLHKAGGQTGKIRGAAVQHGQDVVIHQRLGKGGADDGGYRRDQDAEDDQRKGQGVVMQHIAQHPVQHLQGCRAGLIGLFHGASSFQAGWSKSPPPLTWDS